MVMHIILVLKRGVKSYPFNLVWVHSNTYRLFKQKNICVKILTNKENQKNIFSPFLLICDVTNTIF